MPRTLRPRRGIHPHRAVLAPDERTAVYGLPITTVARTLLDLAAVLDAHRLTRAIERAELARVLDVDELGRLVRRHRRRAGTPALRAVLEAGPREARMTRSELEERLLGLVDRAALPRPAVNHWIALDDGAGPGVEVDLSWPGARLAVELDPFSTHGTASAFERDRLKDQRLLLAGWRVVRVTPRRLRTEPDRVAATLRRLLRQHLAAPAPLEGEPPAVRGRERLDGLRAP